MCGRSSWARWRRQDQACSLPNQHSIKSWSLTPIGDLTADWDGKIFYNFWRPVTAIRNGDMDGNDTTERDPGWTPLNETPMHPEYPSQAAISAGVAVGILESVFGPQPTTTITATDFIDPKLTRQFSSVSQMGEEHNNVRIWGGIHFRNTLVVATEMGRKIAAYLVDNSLKPTR